MSLICRRNNSKTSQVSRAMMDDSRASFWMALRTCKHSRIWLEPCSCLKKTDRYHWRALRKQQLKVRQLMDTASNGPITLPKSISRLKDQIQPLQFKATSSLSYSSALWDLILLLLWASKLLKREGNTRNVSLTFGFSMSTIRLAHNKRYVISFCWVNRWTSTTTPAIHWST